MKNIKISTKLMILALILSGIIAFVGIMGILNLRIVNKGMQTLFKDRILPLEELKNISDAYAISVVDIAHKARNGNITWNKALQELDVAQIKIDSNWVAYKKTKIEGKELELLKEAENLKFKAELVFIDLYGILNQAKTERTQKELDSLVIYQLYPSIDPFTAKIIELTSVQIEISKEIKNTSDEIYSNTRNNSIIFIFVGISFGILLSIYIISGIRKELAKLNEVVSEIAKGDLTFFIDASSNDEIGELSKNLKKMVVRLKQIVSVILAGSENIVKASTESSNTSLQISQGANQQAASAEEASTSLDELSSMIQRNTSRLNETEQIAFETAESIKVAGLANIDAINSMNEITKRIEVISEIANRTTILSINAAIEAARAGLSGKGFAVVADEIRKLAEKSTQAADEINLISKKGIQVSQKSGIVMNQIIPEVVKTSQLVHQISISTLEQNAGFSQINNAIQQLSQVIQQNASVSEELAASAEELSFQASKLKESINFFKINKRYSELKNELEIKV